MADAADRLIACIPRLRRYARALVGDRARADDLVQDTMERGWRHLASCRSDGDMRAWLFGIMHNLYVDQLRRPALQTEELRDDLYADAGGGYGIDTDMRPDDGTLGELERALRSLPDDQRETLLLVALEGMSYEEVATALGIPVGTVMSRLSRARQRLKALREGRPVSALKVVK